MSASTFGRWDDDIDWERERRWFDNPWLAGALSFGVLVVLAALLSLLWGWALLVAAVVGGAAGILQNILFRRRVRGRLLAGTRFSRRQLPVLARRLRKERIPADPEARHVMAELAGRRLRAIRRGRWLWPLLVGLYVILAVTGIVQHHDWEVARWGVLAVACAVLWIVQRHSADRLTRVMHRLDEAPGTPGSADSAA
jgi:hypothetical protein